MADQLGAKPVGPRLDVDRSRVDALNPLRCGPRLECRLLGTPEQSRQATRLERRKPKLVLIEHELGVLKIKNGGDLEVDPDHLMDGERSDRCDHETAGVRDAARPTTRPTGPAFVVVAADAKAECAGLCERQGRGRSARGTALSTTRTASNGEVRRDVEPIAELKERS